MQKHIPVLLEETLELLAPKAGDRVLDVTLGLGGHSEKLLEAIGPTGSLVALDADEENIAVARQWLRIFESQVTILHTNFGELPDCLPEHRRQFDVILADLGLSSPHIDDPKRGFMFREDAPLDMRFDRSQGMTASLLLASLDEDRLLHIFWEYGELPSVRRLVDEIIRRRRDFPVRTSMDLVDVANKMYSYKAPKVLPQIFQALRIAVNREKEMLQKFLDVLPSLLASSGRAVIISYHSLEDTLVKSSFRLLSTDKKNALTGAVSKQASFRTLTKKPIIASEREVEQNSRSRSARLRAILRCS